MSTDMVDHLQMLVLSALFNPYFLAFLLGFYILGRILGRYIPWETVGKRMVLFFVFGLALKLFVFRWGYDLYFILGIPFIAGIWKGSSKMSERKIRRRKK